MVKTKKAVREGTAGKKGETGRTVSTSYGGMTRVRFGGCIPRVGKSRLHGVKLPCRVGGTCTSRSTVPSGKSGSAWLESPLGWGLTALLPAGSSLGDPGRSLPPPALKSSLPDHRRPRWALRLKPFHQLILIDPRVVENAPLILLQSRDELLFSRKAQSGFSAPSCPDGIKNTSTAPEGEIRPVPPSPFRPNGLVLRALHRQTGPLESRFPFRKSGQNWTFSTSASASGLPSSLPHSPSPAASECNKVPSPVCRNRPRIALHTRVPPSTAPDPEKDSILPSSFRLKPLVIRILCGCHMLPERRLRFTNTGQKWTLSIPGPASGLPRSPFTSLYNPPSERPSSLGFLTQKTGPR